MNMFAEALCIQLSLGALFVESKSLRCYVSAKTSVLRRRLQVVHSPQLNCSHTLKISKQKRAIAKYVCCNVA